MIGLYNERSFEKDFWNKWYWGHIDQYHVDQEKEDLEDRLRNEGKTMVSTFFNDETHDGDIPDFILEQFLGHLDEINRFLDWRCSKQRLFFYASIPHDIGSLWVSITGKEESPRKAIFVISKDCGMISGITAYPFNHW